jgi:DNA-binding transcriptional MerR regulator
MTRITAIARLTGASADEIRYLEAKGFIRSSRLRLKQRKVRQYQDSDIPKIQAIIKYRRQGFTWNVAYQKAMKEMEPPPLF